mmetsp:Transcript_23386/g.37438  ORF Transcript_23386/g.37438 Transcript_23386/m.37438 type:complete len:336 (+) Transcript_23386:25-1032(+)
MMMGNQNDKATIKFTEKDVVDTKLVDHGNYYLIPSDLDPAADPSVIRVVAISDTHSKHSQIAKLPDADILVHGGDFTNAGSLKDIKSYDKWIGDLVTNRKKYKYAVLIAGNHDITLEADYYTTVGCKRFHHGKMQNYQECIRIANDGNNVYLLDTKVELFGVTFYGSPYQPEFCNWAFNLPRGKPSRDEWAKIPDKGVDVLMTHGPPMFHGDKVVPQFAKMNASPFVGCDDLLQRLTEIQDVKFHIFGHIHEGYGVTQNKKLPNITFVNASSVDVAYRCVNKPIMFYVKGRGREFCDVKSVLDQEEQEQEQEQKDADDDNENNDNQNDNDNQSQK